MIKFKVWWRFKRWLHYDVVGHTYEPEKTWFTCKVCGSVKFG